MKRRSPKPPARRCTAHLSDQSGRRCKLAPVRGAVVCHKHGGASPQVRRSARERLNALAEPVVAGMERLVAKTEQRGSEFHPSFIAMCRLVLDRTGYGPHVSVEVEDRREQQRWFEHTTHEEKKTMLRIMEAAEARRVGKAPESGNGHEKKVSKQPPSKKVSEPEPEVMLL